MPFAGIQFCLDCEIPMGNAHRSMFYPKMTDALNSNVNEFPRCLEKTLRQGIRRRYFCWGKQAEKVSGRCLRYCQSPYIGLTLIRLSWIYESCVYWHSLTNPQLEHCWSLKAMPTN